MKRQGWKRVACLNAFGAFAGFLGMAPLAALLGSAPGPPSAPMQGQAAVQSPIGPLAVLLPNQDEKKPANEIHSPRSTNSWTNTLGMEFVHIQPGEFTMGSTPAQVEQLLKLFPDAKREELSAEQPAHGVRLTRAFELCRYKVTVGQYRMFLSSTHYQSEADRNGKSGTRPEPWFAQTDDHPVVNVSWNDVHVFCDWLTKKEDNGVRYRLPTEAEWEYACRSGTTSLYLNGDNPEKLTLIGNVADASARRKYPDWTWTIKADDGYVYTSPVGSFAPNAWGLYDMIGNVWEWCEDGYGADTYKNSPPHDPSGPSSASSRVIRGSPWFINPRRCRPADRGGFAPDFRCSFLGFRPAAVRWK